MNDEHRRPAGVDPSVLEPTRTIDSQAKAIGRRVAAKVRAIATGTDLDALFSDEVEMEPQDLATIVEAEIRSAAGTPPIGVVDLRLGWGEALTLVAAVIEAQHAERSATELEILADLRAILFEALGIAPSC